MSLTESERKKRISVLTDDKYLLQSIRLELYDRAEIITDRNAEADLVLFDADCGKEPPTGAVKMSRHGVGELKIPFTEKELCSIIFVEAGPLLSLTDDGAAMLCGSRIRLTEVEYKLLRVLTEKRGEYVTRAEILERVWQNGADEGVVNVYVHYLREKLEIEGEKIILSSRKFGYKIADKYAERGKIC